MNKLTPKTGPMTLVPRISTTMTAPPVRNAVRYRSTGADRGTKAAGPPSEPGPSTLCRPEGWRFLDIHGILGDCPGSCYLGTSQALVIHPNSLSRDLRFGRRGPL